MMFLYIYFISRSLLSFSSNYHAFKIILKEVYLILRAGSKDLPSHYFTLSAVCQPLCAGLMALALAWGMSCGTENISGPTGLRVAPQHQECPQQCCTRAGCCPLSGSQPRVTWWHFTNVLLNPLSADPSSRWACKKSRLWPFLSLKMRVWGLSFGACMGMTVQCELWLLLVQLQQNIGVLVRNLSETSFLEEAPGNIFKNTLNSFSSGGFSSKCPEEVSFPPEGTGFHQLCAGRGGSLVTQKSPHFYFSWTVCPVEYLIKI